MQANFTRRPKEKFGDQISLNQIQFAQFQIRFIRFILHLLRHSTYHIRKKGVKDTFSLFRVDWTQNSVSWFKLNFAAGINVRSAKIFTGFTNHRIRRPIKKQQVYIWLTFPFFGFIFLRFLWRRSQETNCDMNY